ncbi:aldo-keto reductase AKR2E4-like [Anticarsia gemmatalis]|uniref:aldo-keto reductase AKR2E4-like n=1 Tax=Anticarsia gemmatalis TaxID=129554 RepID=UPI003F7599D1
MDWNRPTKLIRPNPDWEEDLFLTCVVGAADEARIRSYTTDVVKTKVKGECCCQDKSRPGVAPRITLNTGQTIPSLGIGTWLGLDKEGGRIPVTDDTIEKAVECAIDAGYRHIDTATIYKTEEQVGRAIKKKIEEGVVRREDLFIVTKLWSDSHAEEAVVPALQASLARLGLTYVDLYLIHWPVAINSDGSLSDVDYLDTWRGMVECRARGLARALGLSNFNQHQLDRVISCSKVKPAVLQIELNLYLQQPSLVSFCQERGVVVVGHSPLGGLFHPPPRLDLLPLVRLADKYHKTLPQIVIRYLLELGVVPIPKSVQPQRIQQNLEVFDFTLTRQECASLKLFDRNQRTLPVTFWKESPYYPFEK